MGRLSVGENISSAAGSPSYGSRLGSQNSLPIDYGVPHQAVIAAIHVAMEWIKVECDYVAVAYWHVKDRRPSYQLLFTPGLTAYDEWRTLPVAPFEDDSFSILRSIKAGSAIGHAQPTAGSIVERKVLTKNVSASRIAVGQWVIRSCESNSHVRTWCACGRLLRRRGRRGATTLGTPRNSAGYMANTANYAAIERQHRAAAESNE
jgi:hypothetical protein